MKRLLILNGSLSELTLIDKAKELDPEKSQANWGYTRYQAYYGYYGPTAAETKKAEEESK